MLLWISLIQGMQGVGETLNKEKYESWGSGTWSMLTGKQADKCKDTMVSTQWQRSKWAALHCLFVWKVPWHSELGMVEHSPSTQEVEARGSQWVPGQSGLHSLKRKTLMLVDRKESRWGAVPLDSTAPAQGFTMWEITRSEGACMAVSQHQPPPGPGELRHAGNSCPSSNNEQGSLFAPVYWGLMCCSLPTTFLSGPPECTLSSYLLFVSCFTTFKTGSHCSPGWPGTHYVTQASLTLTAVFLLGLPCLEITDMSHHAKLTLTPFYVVPFPCQNSYSYFLSLT